MKTKILAILLIALMIFPAFAATFSGSNVPFDSSLHLGLVTGLGTGVSIGGEMFYPMGTFSLGGEIEQQVTNSNFEQNINILKYGLALKYDFSNDIFFTLHIGTVSFYLTKAFDFSDSLSGEKYSLDEDTHGNASYIAFAPNFRVSDYIFTPKFALNNLNSGGIISEFDLNVGKKF
jgi:hypothetical protein